MNKDTAQKILKIFGILNYIFGVLMVLLSIVFFANIIPDFNTEMMKITNINLNGVDLNVAIGIIFLVQGLVTVFEGWALCRASKDSNKTTLAFVLTLLALIGAVFSLFGGSIGVSQITTLILDALLVYSVVVVRQNA